MLQILYQDDRLIAIHKPSGLLVHRSALDRHETRFAVQLLRDQIGGHVYPAHRLDKGTSGILMFALDRDTAARLGESFSSRDIRKRYQAIVRGHPPEHGVIDHPLSRRHDPAEQLSDCAAGEAQSALSRFRRLATTELPIRVDRYPTSRYALLELVPETGRRHQLRRHLKHISHPIIGDATFGKGRHNRMFGERFGSNRLLLACVQMSFRHPWDDTLIDLHCPPSEDFLQVIDALGWSDRCGGDGITAETGMGPGRHGPGRYRPCRSRSAAGRVATSTPAGAAAPVEAQPSTRADLYRCGERVADADLSIVRESMHNEGLHNLNGPQR